LIGVVRLALILQPLATNGSEGTPKTALLGELGIVGTWWAPGCPDKIPVVAGDLVATGHVGTLLINIHFYIYI